MSTIPKAAIEAAIKAYVDAPASASSAETMEAAILAAIAKMGEPVAYLKQWGKGRVRVDLTADVSDWLRYGEPPPTVSHLFAAPPIDKTKDQMADGLKLALKQAEDMIDGLLGGSSLFEREFAKLQPARDALAAYEAEKAGKEESR